VHQVTKHDLQAFDSFLLMHGNEDRTRANRVQNVVTILVEKRVTVATRDLGAGVFSAEPLLRGLAQEENAWEKGKGCDIGYALAISSCEGANSVEACTVTALDAITAFAVPNPNCPSQNRRFFQVWLLFRVAPPS
jgi:hypothetical protein